MRELDLASMNRKTGGVGVPITQADSSLFETSMRLAYGGSNPSRFSI